MLSAYDIWYQALAGHLTDPDGRTFVTHAFNSGDIPEPGDLIVTDYNHAYLPADSGGTLLSGAPNAGHVAVVSDVSEVDPSHLRDHRR